MKYIEYREKREHGTKEFPCACYHVTEIHPRYNMIHHWHNECEFILVRQGNFQLSVDGKEYNLTQGDCALIVGGSLHGGTPDSCVYDCLVFDMTTLLKCSQTCALAMQPILNHEKRLSPVFRGDSEPAQYARDIIDTMLKKSNGYEFFVQGKLLCMLGSIIKSNTYYAEKDIPASDIKKIRKFKKVIAYIEQHYREQITLEEMAKQCGMNRNYFCRAFKEYTKKTPIEYLNYYRIESACEQIVGTEEKLIDIAMNCGFNDYSYFIKVFKSQKGVTPRDFCRKSF